MYHLFTLTRSLVHSPCVITSEAGTSDDQTTCGAHALYNRGDPGRQH